jgi:ComF family protein
MLSLLSPFKDLLHLFYPHICLGCGAGLHNKSECLCISCLFQLPHTQFQNFPNNPTEKIFIGSIPIHAAYSEFYFSKEQVIQELIHHLKYKQQKEIGIFLGEIMGNSLSHSKRFTKIDAIVPLPIHKKREQKRGYNQSLLLAKGISNITRWPILDGVVIRKSFSASQTAKQRYQRWQSTQDSFEVIDHSTLINKNILLVDDVITTGATIEGCGKVLSSVKGLTLYVASLALATK